MTLSRSPLFLALALVGAFGSVLAETADRSQPMNVEADALRYDDTRKTSVFTGGVVLTKGTIVIRGARVDVRQDPDGSQFGQVIGAPGQQAFFKQKRQGLDEYIEGEADAIDYDSRADTVKFTGHAKLRRYRGAVLSDEFTGGVIQYNNTTDVFSIDGASPSPGGPAGGRVRAMLTPKPNAVAPTTAPETPALRTSPTLGKDKN